MSATATASLVSSGAAASGPEAPLSGNADRIDALTGLRAVAALLVVGTHASFATGTLSHGYFGLLCARMDVGVAIFFVLSGYLLFRPWVNAAAGGGAAPQVASYARRRVRRIMPAYIVTVLAAFLVYSVFSAGANPGQSWAGLLRYLTLTHIYTDNYLITYQHQGLSQTWSLAVEASFYAVLPLLAYLCFERLCQGRWQPARLLAGLVSLGLISPMWLIVSNSTDWLPNSAGMWLPAHLGWFAGGMALAVLQATGVRCRATVAVVLGVALYLVVATPIAGGVTMAAVPWWQPVTKNLLYGCIAVLLVAPLALGGRGWVHRVLSCRPMVWLGEISYEVFLLHVLVMAIVFNLVLRWPLFTGSLALLFLLTVAITVPLAWVLRRLTNADARPGGSTKPLPAQAISTG